MISLTEIGTYSITDRPKGGRKVIRNKWVFALKKNNQGKVIRYKARLVAKGFTQIEGIDYFKVFAPVLRFDTVRFLLAFVTQNYRELQQFDIKTAFLNGELEEDIYIEKPEVPKKLKDFTNSYLSSNNNTSNKQSLWSTLLIPQAQMF